MIPSRIFLRIAATLGSALFLSVSGWAEEYRQTSTFLVDLFPRGHVEIEARVGDIRIEAWEKSFVEVKAHKVGRAGSQEKAEKRFTRVKVHVNSDDETVRIHTQYPGRRPWRPLRGDSKLSVDFHIKMPSQASLHLSSVDGDVIIEGIGGHQQIKVTYGSVEVTVPSRAGVRKLHASTYIGFVLNNLSGESGTGILRRTSFWNPGGSQDVHIQVRLGGVMVHSAVW